MGAPIFGGPYMKDPVLWDPYSVPLILGNSHVHLSGCPADNGHLPTGRSASKALRLLSSPCEGCSGVLMRRMLVIQLSYITRFPHARTVPWHGEYLIHAARIAG